MKPAAVIHHMPRASSPAQQGSLPRRYPLWVQWFSMAAFTLAFVGWLNETWLFLFDNPIWLNRYTEYAIILGFGLWRIRAEDNPYTRKRLIVLVGAVTALWWLVPWLVPMFEPYVGYQWGQPVFPALHVPGTITFFLVLGAVFLFGRRVICGWNCPCVGIRETVGFSFRDRTVRGKWAWALRHTKWFFFVFYAGVIVVTLYPPNAWTVSFVGLFYLTVAFTYFGTFFAAPLVGNRFYCRYLCPYGATFGLLNHAGFYGIRMDTDKCVDCRRCEEVCDMGIPVWQQGKASGRVTGIEDCMGCARCVISCPTEALEIRDVRNWFKPQLKQTASHLLGKPLPASTPRVLPAAQPAVERLAGWSEGFVPYDLDAVRAQAARCVDCGVPGCRSACPLANRIPDWLQAVARGDTAGAAAILAETSALPEVCGTLCPQHRLCEGACTRDGEGEGLKNGAVTIGALERWVGAAALELPLPEKAAPTGKRVAVIGAGPAGLACADRLVREGVAVTVYDRNATAGGLLASGVPPFKLDKTLLARRIARLEGMGVHFELGVTVEAEYFGQLLDDYDAVFLGTGAQRSRPASLPGRDLSGVLDALDFLAAVNAGAAPPLDGQRVLVLGGGDSAMDCARSARRLGATVAVATRGDFRASPKEIEAARGEGVELLAQHVPQSLLGSGAVEGVRFDSPGTARDLPADRVILALGQVPAPPAWLAAHGVTLDEAGHIVVDGQGRTTHSKLYAGGDNTRGPDLVVTAMADGRRAAEGMLDAFSLRGRIKEQARQWLPAPAVKAVPVAAAETAP
ncbi:MAG: FAD-dependent oxidoreductase [Thiobacillus sp.]|nr:FAD-dependent oxidoreductase [Thiobacillus sp.]MDP2977420.1 FAD-dependent oxidoreductase [Thiobacillus sp.]